MIAFNFSFQRGIKVRIVGSFGLSDFEKISKSFLLFFTFAFACIGFVAFVIFASRSGGVVQYYSAAHGSAGEFGASSAYLYSLPNFLWPALLICFHSYVKKQKHKRIFLIIGITIFIYLLFNTLIFGNRNGVIRFCIILGAAHVFINRPPIRKVKKLILVLLICVGLVAILPSIRHATHLGSTVTLLDAISGAFEDTEKNEDFSAVGHELPVNIAVVSAVNEYLIFDFGAQYIYPIINFVPRAIWRSKPYRSEFGVNFFELVDRHTLWRVRNGAAISAVAQSFLSFYYFGFLPWMLFGYLAGRIFGSCARAPSLGNLGSCVALILASVYWMTQSFSAFFTNWFFTIAPFYIILLCWRFSRKRPLRKRPLTDT